MEVHLFRAAVDQTRFYTLDLARGGCDLISFSLSFFRTNHYSFITSLNDAHLTLSHTALPSMDEIVDTS